MAQVMDHNSSWMNRKQKRVAALLKFTCMPCIKHQASTTPCTARQALQLLLRLLQWLQMMALLGQGSMIVQTVIM
jgi:hypothetical protein